MRMLLYTNCMLLYDRGKFAQRNDLSKHEYITSVRRYIELMSSSAVTVQDLKPVNTNVPMLLAQYKPSEGYAEPAPNTNVVLAAFVTAQARLRLYWYMDQVDERLLYCDTDSALYWHVPGQKALPLSDYLGGMTDECPGDSIECSLFGGAKNYALKMASGKTMCKIRGFSLNYRTSQRINFDSMKEIMLAPDRFERTVNTEEPHALLKRGTGAPIYTKPRAKCYRFVFDKRRILNDVETKPFGYVDL